MHPQLQAIVDDFELAEKRLLRLAAEVSPADWGRRSDPTRWSIAECVLGRLWIISPFDARIRYNAYACLTILPRHQHRHLWQAEQVRGRTPHRMRRERTSSR